MNGQVSRTYLAYVILLLFLVNAANYGQRMIIAIILPAIKTEIALTDAQLGILMGGGIRAVLRGGRRAAGPHRGSDRAADLPRRRDPVLEFRDRAVRGDPVLSRRC